MPPKKPKISQKPVYQSQKKNTKKTPGRGGFVTRPSVKVVSPKTQPHNTPSRRGTLLRAPLPRAPQTAATTSSNQTPPYGTNQAEGRVTNPPLQQQPSMPTQSATNNPITSYFDQLGPTIIKMLIVGSLVAGGGVIGSGLYGIHNWMAEFGPGGSSAKQATMLWAQVEPVSTPTGRPGGVETEGTNFAQAGDEPTFYYIENAPESSVSESFKNWASQIESLDQELVSLATDQIEKTDTSQETIEILTLNHQLYQQVENYAGHASKNNDEIDYYNYLASHYGAQENIVCNLAFFNDIFEYLLLQTGEGAEINRAMVDDLVLRQSRSASLEQMMQLATDYKKNIIENSDNISDEAKQEKIDRLEDKLTLTTDSIEEETKIREIIFPPALEFSDEKELAVILPQTKSDYEKYAGKNITVDARVYYLLNYIFHVLEMTGEDYEIYKQDWIQEPTSPEDFTRLCGDNIETDPISCDQSPRETDKCGQGQLNYAYKWLRDELDNMGVPYKDRAHLKIWLGLDSPYNTDELPTDQTENTISIVNTHHELKGIDISEIGLYNVRLDCATCEGLLTCSPTCADDPIFCCPTTPLLLDTAVDEYMPIEVQWSHGDYATALTNNLHQNLFSRRNPNQFSPQALIGQFSGNTIGNISNTNLENNFNYFDLTNSNNSNSLFSLIGQTLLDQLFNQTGLPSHTSENINNQNLDNNSTLSSIGGNYLNDALGLDQSILPLIATLLAPDNPQIANDIITYSSLHIPPYLYNNLLANINTNPNLAVDLAFAHIGQEEITNFFGWPAGTIDIDTSASNTIDNLGYRLGQAMFYQINGLPTNQNSYEKNNSLANYQSLAGNILTDITGNQQISNYIHNTIRQNQSPRLFETLQQLTVNDIDRLLLLTDDQNVDTTPDTQQRTPTDTATTIYNYLQNPSSYTGGHDAFLREIEPEIDYQKIVDTYPDLTLDGLKQIIQIGTNPDLGNEYALATVSIDSLFDKNDIDQSQIETQQTAYLLQYISFENNSTGTPLRARTINSNNFGYQSPELINLQTQYYQALGVSESLPQFRARLIAKIDAAATSNPLTKKVINAYQNTTLPLVAVVNPNPDFNQFITNNQQNNYDTAYEFSDQATLPSSMGAQPSAPTDTITINNTLAEIQLDPNSVHVTPAASLNCQNENLPANPITDYQNVSGGGTGLTTGQTYYIYPKIDLAEILVPGLRANNYQNQTGKFKYLETTTNIVHNSYQNPININIIESGTGTLLRAPNDTNPLQTAMAQKYQQGNGTQDLLAQIGGTPFIFSTLNSLSAGHPDQNIQNLAQAGYITTTTRLSNLDLTGILNLDTDNADLADFINTMGIFKSLPDHNVPAGINEAIGLVQQNNTLTNITNTSSTIDLPTIVTELQAGNFHPLLGEIPLLQEHLKALYPTLGETTINNLLRQLQRPTFDSLTDLVLAMISQTISSQTGLDYQSAFNIVSQDLDGYPPTADNLYRLLSNPSTGTLLRVPTGNPEFLTAIDQLYQHEEQSEISPTQINNFIGIYQFFSSIVGQTKINNWFADQGGITEVVLNQDSNTMAHNLFTSFRSAIKNYLTTNGYNNSINIDDLENLINNDLDKFLTDTSTHIFQNNYLSDYPELSDSVQNLQDGQISTCESISLLNNFDNFLNNIPSISLPSDNPNPDNNPTPPTDDNSQDPQFDDLQQFFQGPDPTQFGDYLDGISPDKLFSACRQKIARDNIVHLTDIITSFYKNKRTLNIYGIDYDNDGQLTGTDQDNADSILTSFYPHQVFSDFVSEVLDIISEPVAKIFDYVWPKDTTGVSDINKNNDIWTNDCDDRDNDYLATCKQFIHVSF